MGKRFLPILLALAMLLTLLPQVGLLSAAETAPAEDESVCAPSENTESPKTEGRSTTEYLLANILMDGDKVILYSPYSQMAISYYSEAEQCCFGAPVNIQNRTITDAPGNVVWTVEKTDGGFRFLSEDGKALSFSNINHWNLMYGEAHDTWTLVGSPREEHVFIKCPDVIDDSVRYMDWFVEQSIFSTYRMEPTGTSNPFADVPAGQYYTKAVLWAVENEITNGTGATSFSPDKTCTRGQIVTFLYRSCMNAEALAAFDRGKYEIVVDTCTWEEAQAVAAAKGGKLVSFESAVEYRYVLSLILSEGDPNAYYYLGARRNPDGATYHWIDENNQLVGEALNGGNAWCSGLWQSGEPNLEWAGKPETVVVLFYSAREGRWCWYDGRADAPTANRQYAYIIEYGGKT